MQSTDSFSVTLVSEDIYGATDRVIELAWAGNPTTPAMVFRSPEPLPAGTMLVDPESELVVDLHEPSFVFAIDETPHEPSAHAIRFVFVGQDTTNLFDVAATSMLLIDGELPVFGPLYAEGRAEEVYEVSDPSMWWCEDTANDDASQQSGDDTTVSVDFSREDFSLREYPDPTVPWSETAVNIDVDWNRDGVVNSDDNNYLEGSEVEYLADTGALVLVNCDKDGTSRDMDDDRIGGNGDIEDLSPVTVSITRNLAQNERVFLTVRNSQVHASKIHGVTGGVTEDVWIHVMDKGIKAGSQRIAGRQTTEVDITAMFPAGKALVVAGRLFLEGIRFAEGVEIGVEIRHYPKFNPETGEKPYRPQVVANDAVRVLNTPWLANNNVSKLAHEGDWGVPGSLVLSPMVSPGGVTNVVLDPNKTNHHQRWKGSHGAKLLTAGEPMEFVQDGAEFGFQVRRHRDPAKGRAMITVLRLASKGAANYPEDKFLSPKVGVYGWHDDDEAYVGGEARTDGGGNLEALPPVSGMPFGRLLIGSNMSPLLKAFLRRQNVQWPALELDVEQVGVGHVDEVAVVVPKKGGGWFVMIPDLAAGLALLNRHPKTTTSIGSEETRTYEEIARGITAMALGEDFDKAETALNDFVKTVAYLGKYGENDQPPKGALPTVTVVRVPEYRIWDRKAKSLKAFPRNIANSQPTTAGRMIVPHPPTETLDGQRLPQESSFLTEWKRILLKHGATAEPENVDFPRSRGGEAHCSSNTVRIPIVK